MLGPIMLGLDGCELSAEERELILHPLVGGVILFTRNYQSPQQLQALCAAIQSVRQLPIGVDHEGGRVQRFRDGFTHLPPPRRLGEVYDHDRVKALTLAQQHGWLMAAELRALGVSLSFAPVLDLDRGLNSAIGDRAFHADPQAVIALAQAYIRGMHQAGMVSVGKHFPGHGAVSVDSHHALPVDERPLATIMAEDLQPFQYLAQHSLDDHLAGLMPAHVIYSQIDDKPAGFSAHWLKQIIRRQFGFQGAIISDDMGMAGAAWAGSAGERAQAALAAGVDLILACNDRAAAVEMLDGLDMSSADVNAQARLTALQGIDGPMAHNPLLIADADRQNAVQALQALT